MNTLIAYLRGAVWVLPLCFPLPLGATLLQAGQLQFISYQADNPDSFSFVLWQEVEAGTKIWFTDSGWLSSEAFRGKEGLLSWQATSQITKGQVIQVDIETEQASIGQLTSADQIKLDSRGDQLFAFQGEWDSPTLIAGLQMNGTGWQGEASNSYTSALPEALAAEWSQFSFSAEWDNAAYQGPTQGLTQAQLQQAISDESNWELSQSTFEFATISSFSPQPLSSNEIPAPTTAWLWLIGFLSIVLFRTRSQFYSVPWARLNQQIDPESDPLRKPIRATL